MLETKYHVKIAELISYGLQYIRQNDREAFNALFWWFLTVLRFVVIKSISTKLGKTFNNYQKEVDKTPPLANDTGPI